VQRIRAGETAAERDLVERFSRGIRAILQTVARERAVSEDLHQEALRILLERVRAGGVRDPSQLPAFVASLARNLATRHYQRARRLQVDGVVGPRTMAALARGRRGSEIAVPGHLQSALAARRAVGQDDDRHARRRCHPRAGLALRA